MADINDLISKEALDSVVKLEQDFAKIITVIDKLVAKSKTLDGLISALNKQASEQNAINKAAKEAENLNKQLKDSEDDIVKAKIRFSEANKKQREELKAIMTLEDKESGTLEKLAAKNKLLREEQRKLNLETAEGIKRNKEINTEVNKNTAFIKKNSDALVQHKMNVGNYSNSVMAAGKELAAFLGIAGGGAMILGKLKDAFMETETGVNFFKRATEGTKAFFQSLVSGGVVQAGSKALAAAEVAKKMNEIRIGDRKDLIEIAKYETQIQILRYKAADATLSEAEQLKALTEAQAKEDELIKYKIADKKEELDVIGQMLAIRQDDNDLWNQYYQIQADLISIEGDRNLRLESRATALREKLNKNKEIIIDTAAAIDMNDNIAQVSTDAQLKNISLVNTGKGDELKFNEAVIESNKELHQQFMQNEAEERDALMAKRDLQFEIINGLFDFTSAIYDGQAAKLKTQEESELKAAGDNAAKKEAIEAKYAKKKAELSRKQAVADKAQALFNIVLNTAMGVTNALSKIVTIPLVPFIVALGAVQAAAVVAKPIPAFAKGTKSSPAGRAIVGERGRELMISPSGDISLSPDRASMTYLQRGTKIIPSDETKRILSAAGEMKKDTIEATIERGNREIVRAINEKESLILNTSAGNSITKRKGNLYKEYFNRHLS